jgi:hypothetical protein
MHERMVWDMKVVDVIIEELKKELYWYVSNNPDNLQAEERLGFLNGFKKAIGHISIISLDEFKEN